MPTRILKNCHEPEFVYFFLYAVNVNNIIHFPGENSRFVDAGFVYSFVASDELIKIDCVNLVKISSENAGGSMSINI